jgi:hypothetical protein
MLRYIQVALDWTIEQLGLIIFIILGYAVPVLLVALILSLASCVLGFGGHQVEY